MATRDYDALVLDVDGTLLDERGRVPPRTARALSRARAAGVVVMLATGRAHHGTRLLMRELELDAPAVVFNGGALYCPREDRLIERRVLPDPLVAQLHALAEQRDLLTLHEHGDARYGRTPRDRVEAALFDYIGGVQRVPSEPLAHGETLRIALFSVRHDDSFALYDEVQRTVGPDAHYTHFAVNQLAGLRHVTMQGLDVQPLCDGKAEVFPVLQARFGIAASRVVAVGDADNDLQMLERAGLGVAMANGTVEAKRVARRVIGDNSGESLAALIEELFLG